MSETISMPVNKSLDIPKSKVAKPLLWLGIVSIVMFFAGLTSAYVVSSSAKGWVHFEMPKEFYVSTAIILLSSVTFNLALQAAKKDRHKNVITGVWTTFILGIVFIITQFMGYKALISQGIYAAGKASHVAGSYLYLISFLHILHLLAGLIAMAVTVVMAHKKRYSSQNYLGLQLCGIYWHFLDGLWVYLFLFLLFIR